MFDAIMKFIGDLSEDQSRAEEFAETDYRLAAAALLVHTASIDGRISESEHARLHDLIKERFKLDDKAADKLIERIIFFDGFPNMQVLDPLRIGQNVKEILECDLAAEHDARNLYQEAATYCHSVKDYVSKDLFEDLMKDEEGHIDFLETQLDLIGRIGLELYTQKHVGKLEDGDH